MKFLVTFSLIDAEFRMELGDTKDNEYTILGHLLPISSEKLRDTIFVPANRMKCIQCLTCLALYWRSAQTDALISLTSTFPWQYPSIIFQNLLSL